MPLVQFITEIHALSSPKAVGTLKICRKIICKLVTINTVITYENKTRAWHAYQAAHFYDAENTTDDWKWVTRWFLHAAEFLKLWPQTEHKYGFSPVWVLMCTFKWLDCEKAFQQMLHSCGRSRRWTDFWCRSNSWRDLNRFEHWSHISLRSSGWRFHLCRRSAFWVWNSFSQTGQAWRCCSAPCIIRMWFLRYGNCLNDFPHWVQRNGRRSEWDRSWKLRVELWPNRFVQPGALQAYGRSPVCVTIWATSRWRRWYWRPQAEQINVFFPVACDHTAPSSHRTTAFPSGGNFLAAALLIRWTTLLCIRRPRAVRNLRRHIWHLIFLAVVSLLTDSLFGSTSVATNVHNISESECYLQLHRVSEKNTHSYYGS